MNELRLDVQRSGRRANADLRNSRSRSWSPTWIRDGRPQRGKRSRRELRQCGIKWGAAGHPHQPSVLCKMLDSDHPLFGLHRRIRVSRSLLILLMPEPVTTGCRAPYERLSHIRFLQSKIQAYPSHRTDTGSVLGTGRQTGRRAAKIRL